GTDGNTSLADTWEWGGGVWTQRVATGPTGRADHAMVYDASRQVTILFGGGNGTSFNDTWEWNGAAWTRQVISGPSARFGYRIVYDTWRRTTVLFGGYASSGGWVDDCWEYLSSPIITQSPSPAMACQSASVTFTAAVSGSAPLSYQWRRGALNLNDGGNVSGSATTSLTIN